MGKIWCLRCGGPAAPLRDKRTRGSRVQWYECVLCGKKRTGPRAEQHGQHIAARQYRKERLDREKAHAGTH